MSTRIRNAALAVGLLSICACSEDKPAQQQSTDNASAQTGLDASVAIVHESGGRSRDAASPGRGDTGLVSSDAGAGGDAALGSADVLDAASASDPASALDAAAGEVSSKDAGQRDSGAPALVDAGPPPARSVSIRFKAVVGGTDMSCGLTYDGLGSNGTSAYTRDFRFFVQDLRLINAAGKDVPVTVANRPPFQQDGVSLIDFETGASGCGGTAEVNTEITGTVPPGEYRGIAFTNGVPESLNHVDPESAPAPLRARGMNVNRLEGFRFVRAELVQSGAPADMTGSVELHVNSEGCSGDPTNGSAKCDKPNRVEVRLLGFDPSRNIVLADLSTLFAKVDLRNITVCHSELDLCAPLFERLGVSYDTGKPEGAQQLYRVSP